MCALGRTSRRLRAGLTFVFFALVALALLAPQDALAQVPVLTATPGDGQITLNWTVSNTGGGTKWGYKINGGIFTWAGTPLPISGSNAGTRSHTVTGLTNGTSYQFIVYLQTAANPAFRQSNEVSATPNPPAAGVTLSATSLTVREGGENTYTVKLNKAPSANVTITVGGASGDVTVAGSPLTFTPGNFGTAQTITVRAASDGDTTDDTATLTHAASSTDTSYGASLEIDDVDVTVTDTTPTFQLLTDPAAVTEGTAISLTVTSDKSISGIWPVRLTLAARSSSTFTAADIDGTLGPREFDANFGTATKTGTVTIPTSTDSATEGAEAYRITLSQRTTYVFYAVGTDNTADGTLNDAAATGPTINLTATTGDGQVKLSWTYTNDDGEDFDHWRYAQKKGSGSYSGLGDEIPGGKAIRTYTVTGLENGAAYTFKVSRGVTSPPPVRTQTTAPPYSNEVTAMPVGSPAAPTALSATAGNAQVRLSWTKPAGSITGYKLRYAKTGAKSSATWVAMTGSGASTESHTVTGLDNDAEYSFKVRAVNASGDGAATDWVTATPAATAVTAPVLTAAVPSTSSLSHPEVSLTWTHPGGSNEYTNAGDYVSNAVRFYLWQAGYRLKGASAWDSSWNLARSFGPGRRTRTFGGSHPDGTLLEVRIRAVAYNSANAYIYGPWSNVRTVTFKNPNTAALTITGAPVAVTAGSSASYTVALTKAYAGTLSITSSATAKATVDPATLTFSTTNYSTGQTVMVTGVEAGTATINHAFRLTGATADAIPDAGTVAVTVNAASAAPAKPTGFTAVQGSGNEQAVLSWTNPNDASITKWQYSQDGAWKDVPGSSATTTTHTVSGLSTGTAYAFRVRAVNNNGNGTASDEKTVTPVWTGAPTKPSGLKATGGVGRVTLTWDAQPGQNITRWGFQYKASGAAWGAETTYFTGTGATTSRVITGLTAGTAYDFRLRAGQVNRDGPWSDTVTATPTTVTSVPVAPTALSATAGSSMQVLLTWTKPAGSIVTGYDLRYAKTPSKASATWGTMTGSDANTVRHTVTGLDNDAEYSFMIRAVNDFGDGAATDWVTATPANTCPPVRSATDLSLAARSDGFVVTWTAPTDVFRNGWELSYDKTMGSGTSVIISNAAATSHTLTGLDAGAEYEISLVARHPANPGANCPPGDSVRATGTTLAAASVPAAPTSLSAEAGNGQVTLSWTKPAGSITSYKLRYAKTPSKASATWGAMTGSGAATVRHTVTGLDNDAEYSFMIRAVNASGDGAATEWVTATPAAASTKTITLSATSTLITEGNSGFTDVTVTVTLGEAAPAADPDLGIFSVSLLSASPSGTATGSVKGANPCTAPLNPADTDWCHPDGANISFAEGVTMGTKKVRILGDTRDEPNETIKLVSSAVGSGWTDGTLTLTITDDDDPPTTSVPAKPAGLSAEAGNAQVKLTWTDPDDDSITRYNMRQKKGAAAWGSWTAIPSSDADTTTHTVTGLDNDVEYSFRIRARNSGGNSAQSEVVRATPSASAAVPKPVLSAAPAGYGRVKLSWSALSGVTVASWGYQYKSAGGSWSSTTTVSDGSATSATVTGLTIGTKYTFRLFAAVSAGVQSSWSDHVKATPTNTVPKPVLTAAGGDASVTLSWSALTGIPITSWGYEYKSTGGWSTTTTVTGGSRTSVQVTGLTNGTEYTFRLFAAVKAGVQSVWSDQVKATPAPTPGVRISPTSLTVEEGSSNTYTVKLNTAPSSNVTITVGGESGDVTVTGSPLTFTSGNYNTAQTITVNAAADEDADNDTATLTHTAASSDTDYNALPDIDDVSVTVTDTTPTLQLLNDPTAVTEGTAISLTVTSDRELTGDLTVSLTLADRGSSGFAAADITDGLGPRDFTASFGATARTTATVTIPTATDSDAEGVETYRITLNDGAGYALGNDVTADGALNDAAAKTVSVPGALTVAEDAGPARITITASAAFGEAVTFNITYGGTATGASDPTNGDYDNDVSSVRFNASETAKEIVIPITDDDEVESDETITVTIAQASALPDGFTLSSATTTVTITDNDTPEGTMSVTAGAGQVTLTWEDPSESRIAKWQYQQKAAGGGYGSWIDIPNSGSTTTSYTVTGLTNDKEYSFKVRAVDSSGSELKTYQEVSATPRASVSLSIADVSADEGGTFTFTVTATQAPSSQISFKYTVTAEGEDTAVAGEDFTAVTTATEGSILADATTTTITVSVTDDSVDEDDETFTVTLSEPSEGVSISDGVAKGTIIDNDIAAAVTVAPTELVVEEGASGAYTVALDTKPTGEVTITVSGMSGDVTVDNSSLKFTVDSWDTEQTVTVSAGQDDDAVADAAVTLTHSAAGGGYDAVEIDLVEITITEDDTAGVKVEPTSLTVKEGSSGTYAVALETEPTDEVTITVSGMAGDVTVDKTSLKFTVDSWDTEQTVTVSAANDKDLEDETVTLTHSASGGDYNLVKIDSVEVTVEDTTAERLNKINRAVLPRVTAAMMSQSLDAISYRIEAAALGGIGDSTLSFGATPGALSEEEYVDALWPEEESEDLSVGMREALNGAQFSLGLNGSSGEGASQMEDGKMPWAVWGRGNWMSLSGSDEDITWDGGLWSAHLGADVRLRPELLVGWAVSRSEGDFDADGEGYQGLYETSLTSVHPYVAWLSPGGSSVWGSVGYGRGNVRVGEDQTVISRADLTFTTAAVGGRLALGQSANMISGGVTRFAIKGDGSFARSKTEANKGLEELEVDVRRLRLALQASHERVLEGGGTVTPSLEIGVRHDGGDIDGGAGLEAGATLSYNNPVGLTLEVRTRALLDHNRDWEEWGMGASVTLEPGADQRGTFLRLESSRGETASGIDRLFDRNSAELLTTGGIDAQRRLDAEIGHGFGIGDVARTSVLSPYAGIGLEDQGGRYWRFGTRYRLGDGIDIDLEGARREQQSIDAQNSVMLKGNLRW